MFRFVPPVSVLALFSLMAAPLAAQEQTSTAEFAAPKLMRTVKGTIGASRLYPSPTVQDLNGDGLLDIVVGCLFGKLTVALQEPSDEGIAFAAETALPMQGGKDLKFNNW